MCSPRVAALPVAGGWETGRVSSIELNVNDITNYVVRIIIGYLLGIRVGGIDFRVNLFQSSLEIAIFRLY